ncbi:uncharacterized protein LOC102214599 [Pundamilia nyererei]|uniref:Uncharacterized protein LOC102214599 n=1 Tax=Pundamilia nyererei TaxID=303518 RepID=A0A9Y3R2E9_9CICH|nr:PREDICTED: uncharacterized protein LOC102214599 [Pundamilia nyererei]
MDMMDNSSVADDNNNSDERQMPSEEAESSVRPTLSQVRKSWGFRRTTIARREFMEEVGDLTYSPPIVRRGRNRRTNQTAAQTATETPTTQKATRTARSVIDELQWSAPSSPVSENSKTGSETSAGGSLDPSLWQDFGSAFHTAFTLLGGSEGLSLTMSDELAVPDILEATEAIESPNPQAIDETEMADNIDDMEIAQPVASGNAEGEEIHDVVLISSHEEDSDEMTLLQIKEQLASNSRQEDSKARGGKGGKGKARGKGRGRGRGRGKGRGRGRGKGRAVEFQSTIADDKDSDDDVVLVNLTEQQHLQEVEKETDPQSPPEKEGLAALFDTALSPAQQSNSDCMIIDSDFDQIPELTPGQFDEVPEEEEKKDAKNTEEFSRISHNEGYDSNALFCICRQKQDKRFMICCDSCQEWFHGECVGVSETQGHQSMQEYVCPPCTIKKQSQSESHPQPDPELSFPECLTQSPAVEEAQEDQRAVKQTVLVEEETEEEEQEQAIEARPDPDVQPEAQPEPEMDSSLPLCIGPGCSKQALPDSVYCGNDCILQHAAFTMKTLSGPKVPKSKGRAQRKASMSRPAAKAQRSSRTSKRLAEKAELRGEEEKKEDDGEQEAAASPVICDPSLTEAQATSTPASNLHTASNKDSEQVEAEKEAVSPSAQSPEDPSLDASLLSKPTTEAAQPQSHCEEGAKETVNSDLPKHQSSESDPLITPAPEKSSPTPATLSPTTSARRHHETGALMITKTTYVIPKKQSGSQSPSSHTLVSASCQKLSSAPTPLNETRNLPVPPAPSAPSSRPSQPNNQVRQSIQRSLTSILFKRVCECEDLEMSESEAAKLVASIEMEMFDIFRNTDSKYMNKYRTIMFNLKDPRNKGLLYCVVHGDINPFRLVRMSQKDMQATKAPEPSVKETTVVKDTAAKISLPKPEAVKVDLPSLNPAKSDRKPDSMEQKRSLPAPAVKPRASQTSLANAVPDVLACMLKDTTSEHKTHLFDLKCKICTGQMQPMEEEEPAKKKSKLSVSRDKHEPSWRKSAGGDSPLLAPPDSPDMDSPASNLLDPSSHFNIDSAALTIVESPASPVMDSPASPTLESPASPTIESPASPTPDTSKATAPKRPYIPVLVPPVSTVTITQRRDPRTANRFSASSSSTFGSSNTTHKRAAPYALVKENIASNVASSLPPTKTVPKSILMKPSSTADPRLYGPRSRTVISESPADGETTQFLAKQEILWKGFLNMLTVAKFVTKGYLVSGSPENLKADLPDTIQIGGRIMPQTVWDYVAKLKTSVTKELCVIRFHPATEEEEVAYVSLFSYFSSRGRFGVVANSSRSIKDVYLVPLSAKEPIPSMLQPLEGPGLERNRPNLLLGLAIVQKVKRPGSLPQEMEDKRPKVHMSKDPMWIPKPPVLYGSDKLEIFQPYDPETPASTTPPGSPSCPGSPTHSSSSGSVTIPSLLTSVKAAPSVSTSATIAATQSTFNSSSDKNPIIASSDKTPLQTILSTLFRSNQADSTVSDGRSTKTTVTVKKNPVLSGSVVDPIVQQYGHKTKAKEIEDENDFDRPYDPEEEYDPAMGYATVAPQTTEKIKADAPALSSFVEDDVAYDPEDDTIFEDIQSNTPVAKPPVTTQTFDSPSCPVTVSTSSPAQTSAPVAVMPQLPTGTVVVSAATLSEQQRMLEELNKQIEEQKRQLKEQEEALRQQREAVGMFMAHFSVSDSLMSPPQKSLPLNQLSSLQKGIIKTESKSSETTDKATPLTETVDNSNWDSQAVKVEDATPVKNLGNDTDGVAKQDETQKGVESDKYSSAGEIEDSDVAYDPEDESLFNEIQDDVFKGGTVTTMDSVSRARYGGSHKGMSPNSYHSRKRRSSPKKRSHRERDRHRSPSRQSQHRSRSRSRRRREKDRHRKSERDRSRHRVRDPSERQGRHRKDHTTRRHSLGRRRSPSSSRKTESVSVSPKLNRGPLPQVPEKSKHASVPCSSLDSAGQFEESNISHVTIKSDPDGQKSECNHVESSEKHSHEPLCNVKLEISEPPKFQELQKISLSDHDMTQQNKLYKQDNLFHSKLDSTIPLREIDPPIRDSPQSPDPEPQFVKPSSIEKNDSVRTDEVSDSREDIRVFENNCLPICGQAMVSVGDVISNIKSMDFRALNLKAFGAKGQGLTETHNETLADNPCFKHSETKGQEGGYSNPSTILGMREQGIQHQNTVITGSWPALRDSEMRSEALDSNNAGVPFISGVNPEIKCPSPDVTQNIVPTVTNLYMGEASLQRKRQVNIMEGPLSDRSAPRNVGPGPRDSLSAVYHLNTDMRGLFEVNERNQNVSCVQEGLQCPKTNEHRSEPENIDIRKDVKKMGTKQSFGGPQVEAMAPDSSGGGRGQKDKDEGQIFRSDVSSGMRESGPLFMGLGRPPKTRHDGSMAFEERCPRKSTLQPHGTNADFGKLGGSHADAVNSNMLNSDWRGQGLRDKENQNKHISAPDWNGPGSDTRDHWRGSDSVREAPLVQDEWSVHLSDRRGSNMESQGPYTGGSGGPEFGQPGAEMRGPNMQYPKLNSGGPEDSHLMEEGLERIDPIIDNQGPDLGIPGASDFVGPEPKRRSVAMEVAGPDRRGPVGPHFRGLGPEKKGPHMEQKVHDIRGPGGPDFRGTWGERMGLDMAGPGSDSRGPGIERRDSMEDPGTNRRGAGCPEFKGPGHERESMSIEGPGHENRRPGGPGFRGPGPIEGSGPERRGPGGPDISRLGSDCRGLAMGPGRVSQGPDFSGPINEIPSFPMHSQEPERRGPVEINTSGQGPDRRGSHIGVAGPERIGPGVGDLGPHNRGRGGPHFRGRGKEVGYQNMEIPGPHRRGPEFGAQRVERPGSDVDPGPDRIALVGPDYSEKRYPDMEGSRPGWRKSDGPDLRVPGYKHESSNTEDPRHGGRDDWVACEPIQENPDYHAPEPDRLGQSFRGRRPMRKNIRRPGPGFWGSAPERRGPDTEEQRLDERRTNIEFLGQDRECSVDDWETYASRGFGPIQEGQDEQDQEDINQGLFSEWRGPESSGPGPMQNRPSMLFQGPVRGRRHNWNAPGCRSAGPVEENPDMVCPGPSRGGHGNDWTELDREGAGEFFTGERDLDNRGQDRKAGPGSHMHNHPDMGTDWRLPNVRGKMRGPNIEGRGALRGGPGLMNSCLNRRQFEMEGPDRRPPAGRDLGPPGPANRNLSIEAPRCDGRFSDSGDLRSERHNVEPENPEPGRQGFDFRRESRGPKMRSLGPNKTDSRGPSPQRSDFRNGPGRWGDNTRSEPDPNNDMQVSDIRGAGYVSRGPNIRGRDPRQRGHTPINERRGPRPIARFQHPGDPHLAQFNRPRGPGPNSGGKPFPGFENPQNQQAIRPQRHRGALLPTPKEGLIRFPKI